MKKLGGCFVLRKQGLTEKLRGKCLEFSGNLRNFALDGSNDRAPAFFEADTHYHLHARMQSTCTCQLETGTGLQPTRPIDCVRGASHVVT